MTTPELMQPSVRTFKVVNSQFFKYNKFDKSLKLGQNQEHITSKINYRVDVFKKKKKLFLMQYKIQNTIT
jgi:hypothetical protein